jgi:hypothetical protein
LILSEPSTSRLYPGYVFLSKKVRFWIQPKWFFGEHDQPIQDSIVVVIYHFLFSIPFALFTPVFVIVTLLDLNLSDMILGFLGKFGLLVFLLFLFMKGLITLTYDAYKLPSRLAKRKLQVNPKYTYYETHICPEYGSKLSVFNVDKVIDSSVFGYEGDKVRDASSVIWLFDPKKEEFLCEDCGYRISVLDHRDHENIRVKNS